MKQRISKWFIKGTIAIVVLAVIVAVLLNWFVRRPWPQLDGDLEVAGLTAPVEVIRDEWGIPHIYAENEPDLFFAQGYVHAQDRLWQMDFNRRFASGRLSEILGDLTVDADKFTRTLGLRHAAEQEWETMDEEHREILEAYSNGVNAYIETHSNRLPVEFTILRFEPDPWTPIDSLTWGKLMTWVLSWNYILELVRAELVVNLSEADAAMLMPPYDSEADLGLSPQAQLFPQNNQANSSPFVSNPLAQFTDGHYARQGSNHWVVSGDRTSTGMPMLAEDTHLEFSMPSTWYENGVHGGRFDSVGLTFPGVPLIVIGHNRDVGWAVTDLPSDVQDLYAEKVDDVENPTQYEYMGEWRDIEVREEEIIIRGGEPLIVQVRSTHHGPIVKDTNLFSGVDNTADPVSLRWRLQEATLFKSIVNLNLATDWTSFRDALSTWDAPNQHFVYADVNGNIGYQAAGTFPVRVDGHNGLMPVPGWTDEYEWLGFAEFDQLYTVYNPEEEYFTTANDSALPTDYEDSALYGYDWGPLYRLDLIKDLLSENSDISMSDMQDWQNNSYTSLYDQFMPHLLSVTPETEQQESLLAELEAWDGYFDVEDSGGAIFHVWYWSFYQNVLDDELNDTVQEDYYNFSWLLYPAMVSSIASPTHEWFDDATTTEVETRDDIILQSLDDTFAWLSERYGDDPAEWQWGDLHQVYFVHRPLGASGISIIDNIFNGERTSINGGENTINSTWISNGTFEARGGPVQRYVLDLSNWDNSVSINSTGQSGHLWHPNREDQTEVWRNHDYHEMSFSREMVEENQAFILNLIPANE